MAESRFVITNDQKPALVDLVRRLPAILAGRAPDVAGIAHGFRLRIGMAFLSLVKPNFDGLGRGLAGVDGTKWAPLTREYLAYGRRFGPTEQRDLRRASGVGERPKAVGKEPRGLLTAEQDLLWRKTYAHYLAYFEMREGSKSASAHAASVAWLTVKEAGGKTKLDVYGNRTVQILVDTGYLRESLQPGTLTDLGVDAQYQKPSGKGGFEQAFETQEPYRIVVGTNVKYAKYHHNGKGRRQRRFWPETFPEDWWQQIMGAAISGLTRINDLYRGTY